VLMLAFLFLVNFYRLWGIKGVQDVSHDTYLLTYCAPSTTLVGSEQGYTSSHCRTTRESGVGEAIWWESEYRRCCTSCWISLAPATATSW